MQFVARGDVVNGVGTEISYYAVISIRNEPCCERLVISYADEQTLRNFFAAPSILALGYRSREDAIADDAGSFPETSASPHKSRVAPVDTTEPSITESNASRRLFRGMDLARSRTLMRCLLQQGCAAAVVFLYSKSVLSATVRALVSS